MSTPETAPQRETEAGVPLHAVERSEGPAAAALLAAGIGVAALGVVTTLAEASESFKDWLAFSDDVGPLSGKTIIAVVVWLVAWAILHPLLRRSRLSSGILIITAILVLIGVAGTFPVIFEAFAPE